MQAALKEAQADQADRKQGGRAAAAAHSDGRKHMAAKAGKKRKTGSGSIALDRPVRKRQPPPRWAGLGWGGVALLHASCVPTPHTYTHHNMLVPLEMRSSLRYLTSHWRYVLRTI